MTRDARRLFILAGGLALADLILWRLGGFQVSPVYIQSAALGLLMIAAGLYYQRRRGEPRAAAMLFGAAFLILFSACASVLNSFLIPVAGPGSDAFFDRLDRMLGFHWDAVMLAVARHPALNHLFFLAYNSVLPQIAMLLIALAIWGRVESVYRFCAAIAFGALLAIAIWTVAPAFGAMALYTLPHDLSAHMLLSMTGETGRAQIALLKTGPGFIQPDTLHGSLIGFPSYHAVLAIVIAWHGWELRRLRWPLLFLNAVVAISTPVQGGHHLVDVLGAIPVTAAALFLAAKLCEGREIPVMVKIPSPFSIMPVP